MIIDKKLQFSEGQVITTSAPSTDYIDQQEVGDSLADGDLFLLVRVGTAFAGGSSLVISIQTDDDPDFGSPIDLFTAAPIPTSDLKANTELLQIRLPMGLERYTRLNYTVAGTYTTGTLDAWLLSGFDKH